MSNLNNSKIYIKYNEDVLSGKIPACEAIILACKRMHKWFERDDIYFDYEDVDKKIKFVSLLKHNTGVHANKPFILLPWQQWIVANIYGWKSKEDNTRVTQNVFIMVSRKNGKTALAAALGLIGVIADNEPNAEIDLVANSRQQANIAFEMCYNFAESVDPKKKVFKRYRDTVKVPKTKSKIQVLCSDSMGLDGYNSSLFILDDMHAQKDWQLYNVMKSSQGMRTQPLAIVITTAGFLLNGYPCFEMRQTCIDILKELKEDDTQFSAIYELDEKDDWKSPDSWIKCSPSLGQTVLPKYMKDQVQMAINNPAQEVGVKTKNCNMFCQSKNVWLPDTYLTNTFHKVDLDDYKDEDCYMGVDLAAVSDLTCTSVLFPPNPNRSDNPDKFVFKNFIYIPDSALDESTNGELYKLWKKQKYIICTSGNVVDYDYILLEQKRIYDHTYLKSVAYDSWNATQWAINATNEGLPLEPYSQALGNFNKPTKYFEMLVRQGKIVIDYNPAVRWSFNNVELKIDWNENCKPVKASGDLNRKIDPVIAMLQALGAYLSNTKFSDGDVLVV